MNFYGPKGETIELIVNEDIEEPSFVGGDSFDYYRTPANPAYLAIPKGTLVVASLQDWNNKYDNIDVYYNGLRHGILKNQAREVHHDKENI